MRRSSRRRAFLAFASIALCLLLIAGGIALLDKESTSERSFDIVEPERDQRYYVGSSDVVVPVPGYSRGMHDNCTLRVSDYDKTWNMSDVLGSEKESFSYQIHNISGFGERILWFESKCGEEGGGETVTRLPRKISLQAQRTTHSEIARLQLNLTRLKSLVTAQFVEKFTSEVKALENTQKSDYKILRADSTEVNLTERKSGFALTSKIRIKSEFRDQFCLSNYNCTTIKGRAEFYFRLALPFGIDSYSREKWLFSVDKGRVSDFHLVNSQLWCPRPPPKGVWDAVKKLTNWTGCAAIVGADLVMEEQWSKEKMEREIVSELVSLATCEGKRCFRSMLKKDLETNVNDLVGDKIKLLQSLAGVFAGETHPLTDLASSREIELRLVRPFIWKGGHIVRVSIAVSSRWLGENTPRLRVPDESSQKSAVLILSYATVNKVLRSMFDRPFSSSVWQEVLTLSSSKWQTKGEAANPCGWLEQLFEGEQELTEWTGLHLADDCSFPLRVRPLGESGVEGFIAGMRPFRALDSSRIEVYARAEFEYGEVEERGSKATGSDGWSIALVHEKGGVRGGVAVGFDATSMSDDVVDESVAEKARSLSELLSEIGREGSESWLNEVAQRNGVDFFAKVKRLSGFQVPTTLDWGEVRIEVLEAKNLVSQNALELVGRISGARP